MEPDYPTKQPKDPVADALTDRNSDPAAEAQDGSLKVHGDKLLGSDRPQAGQSDDGPPDGSHDEGF